MARLKAPHATDVKLMLIHPCRNIAKTLGVSEKSVWWWSKHYGLPTFHLPDGQLAITVGLIEEWARDRRQDEVRTCSLRGTRKGGQHDAGKFKRPSGVRDRMEMVA